MKTFLDLLDTTIKLPVYIELVPIFENGFPFCTVTLNEQTIYNNTLETTVCLNKLIDVKDNLILKISLKNKKYSADKETGIKFQNFSVDGIKIYPFYVDPISYVNDHSNNQKSFYLGFNGVWQYNINKPFYQWYHVASGQGWLLEPR